MGTCGKCKFFIWKSHKEEQEGICNNDPKCPFNTGLDHYCPFFEQKGVLMGTCKECKWWGNNRSYGFSECGKMMCAVGSKPGKIVERYPTKESATPVVTFESFGCVHFEQKSKGPFVAMGDHFHFGRDYEKGCFFPVGMTKGKIEQLCSWLNEHWPLEQRANAPFEVHHDGGQIVITLCSGDEESRFAYSVYSNQSYEFDRLIKWLNEHWRE